MINRFYSTRSDKLSVWLGGIPLGELWKRNVFRREATLMAGNNTRVKYPRGRTDRRNLLFRSTWVPHLANFQVWLTPRIVETSRGFKGGAVSYGKLSRQVRQWCQHDPSARVRRSTCMVCPAIFQVLPSGTTLSRRKRRRQNLKPIWQPKSGNPT